MMKIFGGVTMLLVAFASVAMAIPKPGLEPALGKMVVEKKEKFSSVVEKVDTRGNTVVVRGMMKEEKTLTFVVSSKTKIRKGSIPLLLWDVKRAMQVTVEYQEEKDRLSALSIEVFGP